MAYPKLIGLIVSLRATPICGNPESVLKRNKIIDVRFFIKVGILKDDSS